MHIPDLKDFMNPSRHEQENVMLARSSMGGKKTAFIKAAVSEELKEAVARKLAVLRAETGCTVSESEYIERVIAISLFGYEHVAMVEQEQLRRLAGHWSNLVQSAPAA